jgi:hypothetical protein
MKLHRKTKKIEKVSEVDDSLLPFDMNEHVPPALKIMNEHGLYSMFREVNIAPFNAIVSVHSLCSQIPQHAPPPLSLSKLEDEPQQPHDFVSRHLLAAVIEEEEAEEEEEKGKGHSYNSQTMHDSNFIAPTQPPRDVHKPCLKLDCAYSSKKQTNTSQKMASLTISSLSSLSAASIPVASMALVVEPSILRTVQNKTLSSEVLQLLCMLCGDQPRTIIFDCKHLCCCNKCAEKLRQLNDARRQGCPYCKKQIKPRNWNVVVVDICKSHGLSESANEKCQSL